MFLSECPCFTVGKQDGDDALLVELDPQLGANSLVAEDVFRHSLKASLCLIDSGFDLQCVVKVACDDCS